MEESEYLQRISAEPGDPLFAEYADRLRIQGRWAEALAIVLDGISVNPVCHRGRLVLARLFYEQRHFGFAIREVEELVRALPSNQSLRKLLSRIAASGSVLTESAHEAEGVDERNAGQRGNQSIDSEGSVKMQRERAEGIQADTGVRPGSGAHAEVVAEDEFDLDVLELVDDELKKP